MATGNSADSVHRKALLIPFDGRPVQLVSYGIKQRTEQDGSVDFYEYLPDLRQWLKDAFPEQDFYNFHISSDHAQESLRSQDPGNWGNYCLYYTTSLKLPVNQACKTIISCDLAEQRLFFRGDVILVKFQGDLGLGHDYINTPYTMADITMVLIRKLVENESLEKQLKADMEFDKALEDNSKSCCENATLYLLQRIVFN